VSFPVYQQDLWLLPSYIHCGFLILLIIVVASSQFTKDEKDAVVAANLAYEPIKAFDNSVGASGAPAFYSAENGLESALDGFLKAAGDAKF
jgi:hypothetical protein